MTARMQGDLVEYRTGFRGHWRPGFIETAERHRVTVRDAYSRRLYVIELGKRGKVRRLSSGRMVAVLDDLDDHRRRARALPPLVSVIVRTGGAGQAVPAPRRRYRSGAYRRFVQDFPCCNCQAPAPSEAHHAGEDRGVRQKADDFTCVPLCRRCHQAVTDSKPLLGRTPEETAALLLRVQVTLLVRWAGREQEEKETSAAHAPPVLRVVGR